MPVVRIFSALPIEDKKRLKELARKKQTSEYKLVQIYVKHGINNSKKNPLNEYSTRELLQEIWNRVCAVP